MPKGGSRKGRKNGTGEALVVRGEQLSVVLRVWVVKYLADRPVYTYVTGENSFGGSPGFIGPMQWLSMESEINVRKVSGIVSGEFKTVSFTNAEKLLMAIDREYLLSNGVIEIIPNPTWTNEKWNAYMAERGCV